MYFHLAARDAAGRVGHVGSTLGGRKQLSILTGGHDMKIR